jgi:hypothetical protein
LGVRVEKANNAALLASPHAVDSRTHDIVRMLSCGLAWMGHRAGGAATAAARGDSVRTGVATALLDSSSPENESSPPIPLDSVWVQLFVNGDKVGTPAYLEFKRSKRIVFTLATLVKKMYKEDLAGISAPKLNVYAWDDEQFTAMLDPGEIVTKAVGGVASNNPIRIVALTPNTGKTI